MRLARSSVVSIALASALAAHSAYGQWDAGGDLRLEIRVFPQSPAYSRQQSNLASPSFALEPELRYEFGGGSDRLTLRPFLRWDTHDDERSHFDLREANFLHVAPSWDMLAGVSRVFWGVTESVHLVDIINQTDAVEDIDREDKLGQLMLNMNLIRDSGTYSFFILPGFRERKFPGDDARRRGPLPIDTGNATFASGAGNKHVDYAVRWSRTLGDWDIGTSYFYGTSREPRLFPRAELGKRIELRPHYDLIHQLGLDVQYTKGAWLWKLETIARWGHGRPFLAAVGGFEYTLYQIFESNADLGFLAEFQYDGRADNRDAPSVISDNDLFVGGRLALNDEASTAVLAGIIVDITNGTTLGTVEAERRLSNHWKMEFEARLILHTDESDPVHAVRRDSSLTFRLTYSF